MSGDAPPENSLELNLTCSMLRLMAVLPWGQQLWPTRSIARGKARGIRILENAALKIWTTMNNQKRFLALLAHSFVVLGALAAVQGCAVIAVADVVGTVVVKTVGLAADGAIGAVKLTGKAVGAAADAVIPDAK